MPPDRRSNHRSTGDTATDNSDNVVKQPSWDTSVNSLPIFLPLLHKWLPNKNPKYRTWVQYRIVIAGRYTHARSLNHIDRLIANLVTKGTFSDPCVVDSDDLEDLGIHPTSDAPTPYSDGASFAAGSPSKPHYTLNLDAGNELDSELCGRVSRGLDTTT